MTGWRSILLVLLAIGAVAAAFELGRRQGPTAPPAAAEAPPPVPAGAAPPRLEKIAQFSVGTGNVKAILRDGETIWIGTSGGVIRYRPATGV